MLQLEISASAIAIEIGVTSMDIENWLRRGGFASTFRPTTPGKARLMSRANALELAFLSAFVKSGVRFSTALMYAATYLRQDKVGVVREWIYFDVTLGAEHAEGCNTLDAELLADLAGKSIPPALVIIQTGEIVRRIDKFFGVTD